MKLFARLALGSLVLINVSCKTTQSDVSFAPADSVAASCTFDPGCEPGKVCNRLRLATALAGSESVIPNSKAAVAVLLATLFGRQAEAVMAELGLSPNDPELKYNGTAEQLHAKIKEIIGQYFQNNPAEANQAVQEFMASKFIPESTIGIVLLSAVTENVAEPVAKGRMLGATMEAAAATTSAAKTPQARDELLRAFAEVQQLERVTNERIASSSVAPDQRAAIEYEVSRGAAHGAEAAARGSYNNSIIQGFKGMVRVSEPAARELVERDGKFIAAVEGGSATNELPPQTRAKLEEIRRTGQGSEMLVKIYEGETAQYENRIGAYYKGQTARLEREAALNRARERMSVR